MPRTALLTCFALGLTLARAQELVAPTPDAVGPVRGDDWHGYNIANSFETGYRFSEVSGDRNTYRSDVNYRNGVRLLSSFLSLNSRNGKGVWFDEIVLSTLGLGGDPYESARLRVNKNRLYAYDLLWRRNLYFNPGLVTGGGNGIHLLDTDYRTQDHNLTLFPQSKLRFLLGYTHDGQTGAGISTVQLFDTTGNVFPVFANVKRSRSEYRIGNEIHWRAMTFLWTRGWENWKDDTPYSLAAPTPGDGASTASVLNSFTRSEPYHGTNPYWRASLFGGSRLIEASASFTYTSGSRASVLSETAVGLNRIGAAANQQIVSFGDARRPVSTGNATLSVFPLPKLSIVNHVAIYNVRTEGDSTYLQFNNATARASILYFQSLGIRTAADDTTLLYDVAPWLNLHAGYEYSNRRINSVEAFTFAGAPSRQPFSQTNELHAGAFGFRARLVKDLAVTFNTEIGRASLPFTPKSDGDYHVLDGRVSYRKKSLQLSASLKTDYNTTSVALSAYSSHARTYSGSASWSPLPWWSFDAAYSKLHLDTLGGISFFASGQALPNAVSYYLSNIRSANLNTRFSLWKRADLYLGYSLVQDTGDGRRAPAATTLGPSLPAFQTAQTFPLRYHSPLARVSIRLGERLRWNAGYQYYGYREDFAAGRNFLANTGFSSLLWSF